MLIFRYSMKLADYMPYAIILLSSTQNHMLFMYLLIQFAVPGKIGYPLGLSALPDRKYLENFNLHAIYLETSLNHLARPVQNSNKKLV